MTRTEPLPPVAILAGGLGTRLRPITETVPKVLVDVAGRPFLAHQLDLLREAGVARVVLCVGHMGEKVRAEIGDGLDYGIKIDYSDDGLAPLGTGGALKRAVPFLGPTFFVLYGDSYLRMDYQAAHRAFVASGKLGLMTVFRNQSHWDRSNVEFGEGTILAYNKREPTVSMQHIDYGLGLLHRQALDDVLEDEPTDLADLYRRLLARGELAGFEVMERFYEIGSPAGLEETRRVLDREADRSRRP